MRWYWYGHSLTPAVFYRVFGCLPGSVKKTIINWSTIKVMLPYGTGPSLQWISPNHKLRYSYIVIKYLINKKVEKNKIMTNISFGKQKKTPCSYMVPNYIFIPSPDYWSLLNLAFELAIFGTLVVTLGRQSFLEKKLRITLGREITEIVCPTIFWWWINLLACLLLVLVSFQKGW